jgi:hypothetical protein
MNTPDPKDIPTTPEEEEYWKELEKKQKQQ